jgi:molybdate transport system substrate-binding protein
MTRRILLALAALLAPLFTPLGAPAPARAQPAESLLVFAAASLTESLQDIAKLWEEAGNPRIRFNFGATPTLARQLEQGAQAHLFASADQSWMDWAQARTLIAPDTRRTLLGNRLVLVAPANSTAAIAIAPGMDLAALLGPNGRLATGDPSSVPVGIYARQALTKLGVWPAVEPRLARAENVRAALLLVERGEAPLGIVYATDAAVARFVRIVATFPPELLDPSIAYPFAVTRAGDTPAARRLMAFLAAPAALEVFARRGFITD